VSAELDGRSGKGAPQDAAADQHLLHGRVDAL
jgi:hypothetical protein